MTRSGRIDSPRLACGGDWVLATRASTCTAVSRACP